MNTHNIHTHTNNRNKIFFLLLFIKNKRARMMEQSRYHELRKEVDAFNAAHRWRKLIIINPLPPITTLTVKKKNWVKGGPSSFHFNWLFLMFLLCFLFVEFSFFFQGVEWVWWRIVEGKKKHGFFFFCEILLAPVLTLFCFGDPTVPNQGLFFSFQTGKGN